MSSGRNRDYRKPYSRGNVSRNPWQPYLQRRPPFIPQRSRRSEEKDDMYYETRLIDSAQKVFNARVEFKRCPQSSFMKHDIYEGKAKVVILQTFGVNEASHVVRTPSRSSIDSPVKCLSNTGAKINGVQKVEQLKEEVDEDPDGPPVPKVSLFPESKIVLGWKKLFPVGAGMCNLGNTCYLNATLQALFYIPSFCNWLISEFSNDENCKETCKELDENGEKCIICAMTATLKMARNKSGGVIKPYFIYNRLKSICKHMGYGRQEDAHEFLRYLLEKLEQSYLERFKGKQLDNASKETTPVHRIFGGYMRSEICCLDCKGTSTTFQHFQDLMLDIRRSSSLDDALQIFFSRESLEGDDSGVGGEGGDAYKCGKCHIKGRCVKRSSIQTAPKVLCIQLKRFTVMGGKLVKHISYPEKLDMSPYLYNKHPGQFSSLHCSQRSTPLMYHLTSIVSHCGASMNSGHYTATAKSSGGEFYEFDDTFVHQVPLHGALEANAYILIYEMIPTREEASSSYTPMKSTTGVYTSNGGLSTPTEKLRPFVIPTNRPRMLFEVSPRPLNGVVTSVPSFSSTSSSNSHTASSNSTALPPAKEREKVFFDIKSPNQTTSSGYSSSNQSSRLNGTCNSKSHLEYNQSTTRKQSPEPKSQSPVSRTSPKVNGVGGSPTKTNRSQQQAGTPWSASAAKSVRHQSKFSEIDCNQMRSVGSADGREGAEKSLDRLTKLGVLVGVSGKGREVECLGGKVDHQHLVSYPILSGESSDEEEERRGAKRSRKCSEGGVSKHQSSASEMTISGNLTADATAIAASRGWNINGSTVAKGSRDFQKTIENRVAEVSNVRKDLPNGNRVEMSVMNGRERTERNSSAACFKSELKKMNSLEEGERFEGSAAHIVNERLEERPNGTSQPSSPCSSTSSSSSDSCSPVINGATAFKSILKFIDRSNCSMMEDAERKEMTESPSKLKGLPNGTSNVVAGEGDNAQGHVDVAGSKTLGCVYKRSCQGSLRKNLMSVSARKCNLVEIVSHQDAAAEDRDLVHKVNKWLSESDFDACKDGYLNDDFSSSAVIHRKEELKADLSTTNCDKKHKLNISCKYTDSKVKFSASTADKPKKKAVKTKGKSKPVEDDSRWLFIDLEPGISLNVMERGSEVQIPSKNNECVDFEVGKFLGEKVENCQFNEDVKGKSLGSQSSSSRISIWGKVQRSSGASPVPVLGRSDARSLISNPS